MNTEAELISDVWVVRETDDDGSTRAYTITCEILSSIVEDNGSRGLRTCGKPAKYRAITGADDMSGQNYDERFSCGDCKAADEVSGKVFIDGDWEDYGPVYQYEEITEEWLSSV